MILYFFFLGGAGSDYSQLPLGGGLGGEILKKDIRQVNVSEYQSDDMRIVL